MPCWCISVCPSCACVCVCACAQGEQASGVLLKMATLQTTQPSTHGTGCAHRDIEAYTGALPGAQPSPLPAPPIYPTKSSHMMLLSMRRTSLHFGISHCRFCMQLASSGYGRPSDGYQRSSMWLPRVGVGVYGPFARLAYAPCVARIRRVPTWPSTRSPRSAMV